MVVFPPWCPAKRRGILKSYFAFANPRKTLVPSLPYAHLYFPRRKEKSRKGILQI